MSSGADATNHRSSRRRPAGIAESMSKGERFMLILTLVVFATLFFAVAIAPHVPFLAAGE